MGIADTTDRWSSVLDAAEELIRKRGAENWSLAELAEGADMPLEDIQAEFDSEWDVFCSALRRDEECWERSIREAPHQSASDRVMNIMRACVPNYDWTLWIELWSMAVRDERTNRLREELDQSFRALIEEFIREGVEAGEFSVLDSRSAAITLGTLIDALALQATLRDTTVRPNYMLDACVMVSGVLLGTKLNLPSLSEEDR